MRDLIQALSQTDSGQTAEIYLARLADVAQGDQAAFFAPGRLRNLLGDEPDTSKLISRDREKQMVHAVPAILATMRRNAVHASVCAAGCRALGCLVYEHQSARGIARRRAVLPTRCSACLVASTSRPVNVGNQSRGS